MGDTSDNPEQLLDESTDQPLEHKHSVIEPPTLTKEVCYIREVEQLCTDVEVPSLITLLVKVL